MKGLTDPDRWGSWRAGTLAPPRGSRRRGELPPSLRPFASLVAKRSFRLGCADGLAVPQPWAAVMVTAVEGSAIADALGGMHGFPAALTSFVGRAAVVEEIADQLGRDRLVTVTGPGGAGKTRLAGVLPGRVLR